MSTGPVRISRIWVYPIKSLGGVEVAAADITSAGSLALDREWLVTDPDGKMRWQGELPRMAMSRCRLDAGSLAVEVPGMPPLRVARDHDGVPVRVSQYRHDFSGIDAGDEAAAWLSEAFGSSVRLVRIGAAAHAWSGLNPVHVLSSASLQSLNERLLEQDDAPLEIERFRPNLLLEGDGLPPFFEEQCPAIDFGDAKLVLREPCVRCELPNISRLDASRGKQPLKLIGGMSRERPHAVPASFGIYARLDGTRISTGMRGMPVDASSADDYLATVRQTLGEWDSAQDERAYRDL